MSNKGAIIRAITLVVACVLVIALIVALRRHPQATPSSSGGHASPAATATPPGWVVAHSPLHDVFMHWNELHYIGPGSTPEEPAIGKVIASEHWAETDGSGRQIFQRSIFTLPDGSLYQETFDNAQESIIIRGPAYYGVFGDDADDPFWCVSKSPAQSPKVLDFPYYIDMQRLQADSFAMTTSASAGEMLPAAPTSLNGVSPTATFALPSTYQVWTNSGPFNGYTQRVRFATDAQQRVVSFDVQILVSSGRLQNDQWYSISPVAVYPSSASIPASVMQEPLQVTKGCK